MNKRQATIRRTTNETDISLSLTLEGQGIADVETGDGFLDHMLILSAVDLSGRSYFGSDLSLPSPRLGSFDTELVEEFFLGFTRNANCTLHFKQFAGRNTHHIIEGAFKAFGRALREAVRIDPELQGDLPTTKGVL